MNFYLLHFKCLREMGNGFSQQNLVIREFPVNSDVRIPVTSSKDWQSRITKIFLGTMAVSGALFIIRNRQSISDLQSSLAQKIVKGLKFGYTIKQDLTCYDHT